MTLPDIFAPVKTGKFWKELLIMIAGMLITAASIYYFVLPTNLVVGNLSGFAIVVSTLFAKVGVTLKVSWIITLTNVFLLTVGYIVCGREFGAKTVFCALILGPMMELLEAVCPYTAFLTEPGQVSVMNDIWMDIVCYVLLLGLAQAMLFRINASTGGLDIVAKIINKFLHYDIGTSVTYAGFAICLMAFIIHPFRMVVIGLITTWLNGVAVDYFTAGLNRKKRVCIITEDYEQLRRYIIEDLHRGCSLYPIKGGFHCDERTEIQALLTKNEFAAIMEYVRIHDIKAFITAGNVSEVYGYWIPKTRNNKKTRKDNV